MNKNYKFQIFRYNLRERGVFYTLKMVILYLLRPINNLITGNRFLINLWYGVLTNLEHKLSFYKPNAKFIKLPQTELVQQVRKFWYCNIPGNFDLDGEEISRKDFFAYGGPNPKFTCPICQKSEWLSRVRQKNLFRSHNCPQTEECEDLCKKQGDELWTHFHQNFDFMIGCDDNFPAPKCLYLVPKISYQRFLQFHRCDQGILAGRRRLATVCQIDVVKEPPLGIDWSKYDFLFMFNEGNNPKFPRPNIPVILYGHDFWERRTGYQWVIDWAQPDIFLTSYPAQWKENYRFPSQTKIVFYPLFPSLFFTRPNLREKKLDMLVIGATASPIYQGRIALDKQIADLNNRYRIEFSHRTGALATLWAGPTSYTDSITKSPVRCLNKWSEYLASAKYVIFGRMKYPVMGWKYYETLGSGAIPIFPELPDLKLLGVKAFEHYIPLSEVEGNNKRLKYFLDNYDDFRHVAENAVNWYKDNENKMLFEDFENLVRETTNYKYPKRLI